MRKINKQNPVYLITIKSNEKIEFYGYSELIHYLKEHRYWILQYLGTTRNEPVYYGSSYFRQANTAQYIVRDIFNNIYKKEDLCKAVEILSNKREHVAYQPFRWYRQSFVHNYKIRCDPVPFIGKSCTHRYYKQPKTTAEKRDWDRTLFSISEAGYNVKLNKKRSPRNMPQAWDDYPRACYKDKSWKRFRKTQYKPVVK